LSQLLPVGVNNCDEFGRYVVVELYLGTLAKSGGATTT